MDLSKVSTVDLHEELAKRTGVKEIVIGVGESVEIYGDVGGILNDYGPMRILINED